MLLVRTNAALKTKGLIADNPRVPTKHAPDHLKWSMAGMETCSIVMSMGGAATLLCWRK